MDLKISNQLFIVCGASSGFGRAIAEALVREGARIIAIARNEPKLKDLQTASPDRVRILAGDIAEPGTLEQLLTIAREEPVHGVLVNAGGPPAKTVMETTLDDWDTAYRHILRWKVALTQSLAPGMIQAGYGRFLYIESSSVKQPLENLVLSNAFRVAVTGFVKTFSREIAATGVTLNVLAPGSHDTPAIERIYRKKSEQTNTDPETVRRQAAKEIPVGFLGDASDLASLAVWLLSPFSRYITGQTISVDGGQVRGIFG
ncbi:MAG: SDR family oxidoreductase [Puia sp.]|nr:SDR family oxidoreductase [Puia sp.]